MRLARPALFRVIGPAPGAVAGSHVPWQGQVSALQSLAHAAPHALPNDGHPAQARWCAECSDNSCVNFVPGYVFLECARVTVSLHIHFYDNSKQIVVQ